MGTIRTAIALYDGVTSPLQSMHKAMGVVLNTFESMQQASGRAVDTAAIREAREEWAKAGTAFDAIEENIRNANNEQQKFNNSIRGGNNSANGLLSTIKKIAVAAGGIAGINKVQNISDKLASTKARLNLLVDDGGSVDVLEQKIMASAQRSRSVYFDTASAVAKLGLNAGNAFNGDMDQVIAFMEQVNKQFVIGGATAQEQSNAMIQLTQAMAAGALRGEELNSILDAAPGIARAIEQYMGVAEGSIKQYAEQGLVTAEVVKNAMFDVAKTTNDSFNSMPMTWAQIWTSMQNKALSIFNPILTKINELANSELVGKITDGIVNGLAAIATIANVILDLMINVASVVVDNWSWLSPIILGVAAALGVYYGRLLLVKGAELASAAVSGVVAVAKGIMAAATMLVTGATWAQVTAQYGLNAAMYACPIVWIIILIIALVALFYAAVAAVNHFAGTSVSATGIICGAFMAALAFIGNIFVALWNLVVDVFVMIYNLVATVANFIGNVFNDPVAAVARLFFDLADTVLSVLQALASAIDTIFGSNLSGSVQGWRDSLGGWVDSTFGKGEEVMEKLNAEDLHLGRVEYGAAFDMGYEFGQGVEDTVGGLFDFSAMDSMGAADGLDAFNLGNTLDGIYGNTGDTAGNTAAMSEALDIAEEDLAYMRDIAEREAINRFTTAEIKVEQHNENHISKDTDLDGIMDAWANDFAEKLDVSEEGVHE